MAPTVFVPKKSEELRICVDYRALNKQTVKDSYPLPLPDEVQGCLTKTAVFSTLDLHYPLPLPDEVQGCLTKTAVFSTLDLHYPLPLPDEVQH